MNCNDKISNLCGTKTYAPCVFYASKLPTFSGITHDCVTLEDTTEDLYNILKDVREQLDLTSLGNSCLNYPLDSQGRITTTNVLSTLEEKYCTLQERVVELETSGAPSIGGLGNLVDDTTPQLGGNLDLNGFSILGLSVTESQISDFKSYQPVLTSGVNIKTVNGTSLLGSGNISISGSGVVIDNLVSTSTTEPLSANQGRILKSTQDIQQSAININSAKVSNVAHPLVETAVPVGAVFTDTVYDDTALSGRVTTIEGFVDQDVSSGAAPILDATNFTNLPVVGDTLPLTSTIAVNTDAIPAHIGGVNEVTSATDVTVTIQSFATQAIPVGTVLLYSRKGAGNIIIAYSGVTGDTNIQTYAENDIIRLWHKATNVWEALDPPQEGNTINSITTGEPTGATVIPNIVSISQVDYDAAVAATTLVATTTYIIQ